MLSFYFVLIFVNRLCHKIDKEVFISQHFHKLSDINCRENVLVVEAEGGVSDEAF